MPSNASKEWKPTKTTKDKLGYLDPSATWKDSNFPPKGSPCPILMAINSWKLFKSMYELKKDGFHLSLNFLSIFDHSIFQWKTH